jgi:hypothetical protein
MHGIPPYALCVNASLGARGLRSAQRLEHQCVCATHYPADEAAAVMRCEMSLNQNLGAGTG